MTAMQWVEVEGFRLGVDPRNTLGLGVGGAPEPETVAAIARLLHDGEHAIDVGANVGYFTLHMARRVGPRGHVTAVEPQRDNVARLRANLRTNGVEHATVHAVALGRTSGQAALYLSDWSIGMHRLYPSVCCTAEREPVPVVTLDDLVGAAPVDLIKIDIEGYELPALEGARRSLDRNRGVRLIAEYCPFSMIEAGESPAAFLAYLHDLGFAASTLDGRPIEPGPLRAEARRYEAYGREAVVAACRNKSNPEILAIAQGLRVQLRCERPLLENLLFAR